jgi:hypothetical protein
MQRPEENFIGTPPKRLSVKGEKCKKGVAISVFFPAGALSGTCVAENDAEGILDWDVVAKASEVTLEATPEAIPREISPKESIEE